MRAFNWYNLRDLTSENIPPLQRLQKTPISRDISWFNRRELGRPEDNLLTQQLQKLKAYGATQFPFTAIG